MSPDHGSRCRASAGWAKSVRRDIHKMHAFVRFREVPGTDPQAFIAWFEPEHHIVEASAPFFVRRFTNLSWAILTPERSAYWDLQSVVVRSGRTPQRCARGRCRRRSLATVLRQHFQSGAPEGVGDASAHAEEVLAELARERAHSSIDRRCAGTHARHDRESTRHDSQPHAQARARAHRARKRAPDNIARTRCAEAVALSRLPAVEERDTDGVRRRSANAQGSCSSASSPAIRKISRECRSSARPASC